MAEQNSSEAGAASRGCDRLWSNARLATLAPALPGLGEIDAAAVAVADGRIVYAGPEANLPTA